MRTEQPCRQPRLWVDAQVLRGTTAGARLLRRLTRGVIHPAGAWKVGFDLCPAANEQSPDPAIVAAPAQVNSIGRRRANTVGCGARSARAVRRAAEAYAAPATRRHSRRVALSNTPAVPQLPRPHRDTPRPLPGAMPLPGIPEFSSSRDRTLTAAASAGLFKACKRSPRAGRRWSTGSGARKSGRVGYAEAGRGELPMAKQAGCLAGGARFQGFGSSLSRDS